MYSQLLFPFLWLYFDADFPLHRLNQFLSVAWPSNTLLWQRVFDALQFEKIPPATMRVAFVFEIYFCLDLSYALSTIRKDQPER